MKGCVGVGGITYNQHGRPHHLRDTLPELGRGAGFAQTPGKPPGLWMRRSCHRFAPLCTLITVRKRRILNGELQRGNHLPVSITRHELGAGSRRGVAVVSLSVRGLMLLAGESGG